MGELRRESMVGLLWAGGLVLAMITVFFYGLAVYEPERFDVQWAANAHEQGVEGELAGGAAETHTFAVPGTNVTSVRVELEWTDALGEPDVFEVAVTGPAGAKATRPDASGLLVIEFPLVAAPTQDRIEGPNIWDALAAIERHPDAWQGAAVWNLTVTLVEANGVTGTPAGLNDETDPGNAYTLRIIHTTHDATLRPAAE